MFEQGPIDHIVPQQLNRQHFAELLRTAGVQVTPARWEGSSDDEVRASVSNHNLGYISRDGRVKYNSEEQRDITVALIAGHSAAFERMDVGTLFSVDGGEV